MAPYKQNSKILPSTKQRALKILKGITRNENYCNTRLVGLWQYSTQKQLILDNTGLSQSFSLEEKFGNNPQSEEKYTGKIKDCNCKGQGKRLNQADTSNMNNYFAHHAATVASKFEKRI